MAVRKSTTAADLFQHMSDAAGSKTADFRANVLIFNGLDSKLSRSFNICLHVAEFFGGVALPADDLAYHPQRDLGAIRQRRIAWKLLVGQVGIVFNGAGRLHNVDPAGLLAK